MKKTIIWALFGVLLLSLGCTDTTEEGIEETVQITEGSIRNLDNLCDSNIPGSKWDGVVAITAGKAYPDTAMISFGCIGGEEKNWDGSEKEWVIGYYADEKNVIDDSIWE